MRDDATDAERYRWLRRRLEVRWQEYLDGEKRQSFSIRVGCARIDQSRDPGEGYLSQDRFESDCQKIDAAIDAALTK